MEAAGYARATASQKRKLRPYPRTDVTMSSREFRNRDVLRDDRHLWKNWVRRPVPPTIGRVESSNR